MLALARASTNLGTHRQGRPGLSTVNELARSLDRRYHRLREGCVSSQRPCQVLPSLHRPGPYSAIILGLDLARADKRVAAAPETPAQGKYVHGKRFISVD